jgi:hypothetical protein
MAGDGTGDQIGFEIMGAPQEIRNPHQGDPEQLYRPMLAINSRNLAGKRRKIASNVFWLKNDKSDWAESFHKGRPQFNSLNR